MISHGFPSAPVVVTIGRRPLASLDIQTIQQYLPHLLSITHPRNPTWRRTGHFELPRHMGLDNRLSFIVLQYIFRYLEEIEREGDSAALYDKLESLWKNSRLSEGGYYEHRSPLVEQCFCKMGSIFDRHHFGCHPKIYDAMSTFFARHCKEIMQSSRHDWREYVYALYRIEHSMTSVLACVAQNIRHTHIDQHSISATTSRGHRLTSQTISRIFMLLRQKDDRRHEEMGGHHVHPTDGYGPHGHMRNPELSRSNGELSVTLSHPGTGRPVEFTTGLAICPDRLRAIYEQDPRRILVKQQGSRHRGPRRYHSFDPEDPLGEGLYGDDHDDDDDYSSMDSEEFYDENSLDYSSDPRRVGRSASFRCGQRMVEDDFGMPVSAFMMAPRGLVMA
ncbi:hypothetical protein MMC24_003062 [Lignoscripta atroalba]|nr:hypothetical protein [Lignoscripta atroalba]